MMEDFLKGLRGSVRPVITYVVIGIIAAIVFKFAAPFLDKEAAIAIIFFIIGAGTNIMAYYFGERKASK